MFFLVRSFPIFCAAVARPSFVDTPIITGRLLRRCAFAASVTHESVIPFASFASVLPVHGSITSASRIAFGPIGSASLIVCIISFPVFLISSFLKKSHSPNLVSVE